MFLLAAIILAIKYYRRKKKGDIEPEPNPPGAQPLPLYAHASENYSGRMDEVRSPAWSGHKSELDAIGTAASISPRRGDFSSAKSEVEGSPAFGTPGRPLTNGGFEMPGHQGTIYEMPG
jgi:hypothetical protein